MNELTPSSPQNTGDTSGSGTAPEAEHTESQRGDPSGRAAGQVLDKERCLAGLSQLPGLLALGYVGPSIANAMRGAYRDILQHHQHAGREGKQAAVIDSDVLQKLRDDPAMLDLMAPLLTDEQLKSVMREEATDGPTQT